MAWRGWASNHCLRFLPLTPAPPSLCPQAPQQRVAVGAELHGRLAAAEGAEHQPQGQRQAVPPRRAAVAEPRRPARAACAADCAFREHQRAQCAAGVGRRRRRQCAEDAEADAVGRHHVAVCAGAAARGEAAGGAADGREGPLWPLCPAGAFWGVGEEREEAQWEGEERKR